MARVWFVTEAGMYCKLSHWLEVLKAFEAGSDSVQKRNPLFRDLEVWGSHDGTDQDLHLSYDAVLIYKSAQHKFWKHMSPSSGSEVKHCGSLCDVCICHVYLNIKQELGEGVCIVITHEVCTHLCVWMRAREEESRGGSCVYVVCHSIMMATVRQNIGLKVLNWHSWSLEQVLGIFFCSPPRT